MAIASFSHRRNVSKSIRKNVDHTYHDFSCYLQDGGQIDKPKKAGRNFPAKLHQMISDAQFSHMISWEPHGRAFRIIDKELLTTEAIPTFFDQTKFRSFTRQLSGWGFKRLRRLGPDFGCYYHECFLRGLPLLTNNMKRVSSNQGKLIPHPEGEPDFCKISSMHPLPSLAYDPEAASNYKVSKQEEIIVSATMPTSQSMPHIQAYDWNNIVQNVDNEASIIPRVRSYEKIMTRLSDGAEYSTASSVAAMNAASTTPTHWVSPKKTAETLFSSSLMSTAISVQMNDHAPHQATNAIHVQHSIRPADQIHSGYATKRVPASSLGPSRFQSSHDREGSAQEEYDDYTHACHNGEEEDGFCDAMNAFIDSFQL